MLLTLLKNNFTKEFENIYKRNSPLFPDNHHHKLGGFEIVSPSEMTLRALML